MISRRPKKRRQLSTRRNASLVREGKTNSAHIRLALIPFPIVFQCGMSNRPLLNLQSVRKSYGRRPILDGVTFGLAAGERVALMGPSGSGKSTLLNCIGGIDRIDGGEIRLEEKAIHEMSAEALSRMRRRQVTTIFQFFHLLPTLTAAENIEFPLQLLGLAAAERAERVSRLLAAVGVDHRADALPEKLSGGEMQRVAIARALAPEPSLILADEPTGNLDTATGESILDLIEELSESLGFALLLVTHSGEATRICGRILHLRDGCLENSGS